MDTGVAIFPTHDRIGPAEVARLAATSGLRVGPGIFHGE